MTPYQIGQAGGALVVSALLTALLYGLTASWPKSISKLVFINGIALVLLVLMRAVGTGISAEAMPSFSGAWAYIFGQAVVAAIDLFRFYRRARKPSVIPDRIEPKF
jgi:hypothetical protein